MKGKRFAGEQITYALREAEDVSEARDQIASHVSRGAFTSSP
jgi:hypothetical protein